MTWRPIKTAPKDTRVLLYDPNRAEGFRVASGWWTPSTKSWRDDSDLVWHPTHWQPLPEEPPRVVIGRG